MPPPLIGSTAAPHLDMPETWSSNADALDTQLKALDAVESEYRSVRRLLAGAPHPVDHGQMKIILRE